MSQEKRTLITPEAPSLERGSHLEFKTLDEARAYQQWKKQVPLAFRRIVEAAMLGKTTMVTPTGLLRVDAFLTAIQAGLMQSDVVVTADDESGISGYMQGLRSIATNAGRADGLKLLADPKTSFSIKHAVWRDHVEPLIHYLREQDLQPVEPTDEAEADEPAEREAEETGSANDRVPPPDQDSFEPSMDDMSQGKEGETNAQFTVSPFYGGYYRKRAYANWNHQTLSWAARPLPRRDVEPAAVDDLSCRLLSGCLRGGQTLSLPIPYGWTAIATSAETTAPQNSLRLATDDSGATYISVAGSGQGVFEYQIRIAKRQRPEADKRQPDESEKTFVGDLPDELTRIIAETQRANIPSSAKARTLIKCVREHLEYSNDSLMNQVYRQNPAEYFKRIWQEKKADCDVANTLAAAVLRAAGIPCRLVIGHFVKTKTADHRALLTSGTTHAWLEAWDEATQTWFRADATPTGDPTLDDERPDEQAEQEEPGDGDDGEQQAEIMSDAALQKLMEELGQAPPVPERPMTSERREEEKFAEQAECPLEEAQQVRAAFRRVRELRNAKGERISQLLINAWRQLVRTRLRQAMEYTGPVRRSQGDDLADPVEMKLDRRAGDHDPGGYERFSQIEKQEKLFGGLDIYLQLDLSGSMAEIDKISQEKKCDMQRDFALLYADSLMQCAILSRQAQGRLQAPLPIRLQIVSIHGGASVDLPLCGEWGPKEMAALYRSAVRTAGGGTPDHIGLQLIERRIQAERQTWKQVKHKPHEKPPIEFVAVSLDGGSDDPVLVESILRRLRGNGAVVFGYGMTAAANAVQAIYAPDGRMLTTLSEHAAVAADDTIAVFKRLYPEHVKR